MFEKLSLISFLSISSFSLHAAERVKLDLSTKVEKEKVTIQFKVKSMDSLKLNYAGPWHLKLGGKSWEIFDRIDYGYVDFKKEIPGFLVVSKKLPKKKGVQSLPYELTAYSCTSDASQCFHDVLKGEFSWKATP